MTTSLRHAWLTPLPILPERVHVTIREDGRCGIVWDGTPLDVQIARDAIAVIVEEGKPAMYYRRDEIEIEGEKMSWEK